MSLLYCQLNGQRQFSFPCLDRGLSYGDGVFTTANIVSGSVVFLSAHLERLTKSCQTIGIVPPPAALKSQLQKIARAYDKAVLKVIITAGEGGRGYSRTNSSAQNILITVHEYPTAYHEISKTGIHLGVANSKLGINPQLAGIKHLNRLEQVLIRQELDDRDEDDILVLNYADEVVEVSAANIFFYQSEQERWLTPSLVNSGVNGIIRQQLLERDSQISVVTLGLTDIMQCTAMFICNSVMGIVPVHTFCDRKLDLLPVIELKESCDL